MAVETFRDQSLRASDAHSYRLRRSIATSCALFAVFGGARNRSYRNEVLSAYLFDSIYEVRQITEIWLREYNEERPHDSLGRVPP